MTGDRREDDRREGVGLDGTEPVELVFDDEEPELTPSPVRSWADDHESDLEELLERQHYAFPAERPATPGPGAAGRPPAVGGRAGPPVGAAPFDAHEAGRLLAAERRRLLGLRRALGAQRSELVAEVLAPGGQHPADVASETYEREVDESLLDAVEAELVELDAAERRLAGRRYGWCEACSRPIPADRLRAAPLTRRCRDDEARAAGGHT